MDDLGLTGLVPNIAKTAKKRSTYDPKFGLRRSTDIIDYVPRVFPQMFLNNHPKRVAYICWMIGTKLNMSTDRIRALCTAAILHDAGKVHPETKHYFKSGWLKFTPELRKQTTELHQRLGPEVIDGVNLGKLEPYRDVANIVAAHHHYSFQEHKNDLPKENWIVAVADTWDAMTCNLPSEESERGYRTPLTSQQAVNQLVDLAIWGKIDPSVVEVFIKECLMFEMPRIQVSSKPIVSDI